jgi:hypothetical protein
MWGEDNSDAGCWWLEGQKKKKQGIMKEGKEDGRWIKDRWAEGERTGGHKGQRRKGWKEGRIGWEGRNKSCANLEQGLSGHP